MRKVQETKPSEVFALYIASAAARGVKDKTLRTYEQHLVELFIVPKGDCLWQ